MLVSLVGCAPPAAPRAPDVASAETRSAESRGAEEATQAPKKPKKKTFEKSRFAIGSVNLSELLSRDDAGYTDVVSGAGEKLGLKYVSAGNGGDCDHKSAFFEFTKGKAKYELGWAQPSEEWECRGDEVGPDKEPLPQGSVREIDAPAGVTMWVKTTNGDAATAKKLFDAVFKKR